MDPLSSSADGMCLEMTRRSFQKLKGNISQLKDTVLHAFNSNGWVKSWGVLDYDKFQRVSGCDLYD